MDKVKKIFLVLFVCALTFLLFGCNSIYRAEKDSVRGELAGDGIAPYDYPGRKTDDIISGYTGGSFDGETSLDEKGGFTEQASQLTASVLNDNDNFSEYLTLVSTNQEGGNVFYSYQREYGLYTNRIKLTFKNANNIRVELLDEENNTTYEAVCDENGVVYLFNNTLKEEYNIKYTYNGEEVNLSVKDEDVIDNNFEKSPKTNIQLMFVVDTTGSMGDEISYLKSEIKNVIERVKASNDNINIYLSLIFYRDFGDTYVVRDYDFTTDITKQIENLGKENAAGGGDFEEAVEEAFKKAAIAQWLPSASTNILIHVADAPAHKKDVATWFESVDKLASQGVRIINVASSGINKATEYLFRNECFRTGGYYCYLTNHSKIGGTHIDPSTTEVHTVEYLNDCLVRLINGIHTGEMAEPVSYDANNQ